jgi:hypothetical protein
MAESLRYLLSRTWQDEESKGLVVSFLHHLVCVAHHNRLPIQRRNLGYLQALLGQWVHGNQV